MILTAKRQSILSEIENTIGFILLFILMLIPVTEAILRSFFNTGITAASTYTYHMVLLVTFIGGMITSRENSHLGISIGTRLFPDAVERRILAGISFLAVCMNFAFAWSSLSFVFVGLSADYIIGFIPVRIFGFIMPIGFFVMGIRSLGTISGKSARRIVPGIALVISALLAYPSVLNLLYEFLPGVPDIFETFFNIWAAAAPTLSVPLVVLLILSAVLGAPIYIALGGIALILFAGSGGALEVIPNEAYTLLTSNTLPAIPLFTFAGFILSESKAGERLVKLFQSLFGWMPGGLVIMVVLVSAFFTTFTGASGVTILALGSLLSYVLVKSGRYSEKFSTGLLTSVGSIGLLFPPSLPIILYAVAARVSVLDLFLGGILPGTLMVLIMSLLGVFTAVRSKITPLKFNLRDTLSAVRGALWEILMPVVIVVGYFSGLLSLVETSAVAVAYALIVEVLVHREIRLRDLSKVALKSLPIIGGIPHNSCAREGTVVLHRRCRSSHDAHRLGSCSRPVEIRLSDSPECCASHYRLFHGYLLGNSCRRSAHHTARCSFRHQSRTPGHHFHYEHGTWFPHTACRFESFHFFIPFRQADRTGLPFNTAVFSPAVHNSDSDNVPALALYGAAGVVSILGLR